MIAINNKCKNPITIVGFEALQIVYISPVNERCFPRVTSGHINIVNTTLPYHTCNDCHFNTQLDRVEGATYV